MELKTFFAQDLMGNVIPSPVVTVYQPGTTTLATGLQKADGTALTNPFTGTGNGQVTLAAPDGDYDLKIEGAGRTTTMRVRFIDAEAGSAQLVRDDLAASTGSSLVGFQQAGTGAVPRTAQDKMREVQITPQDFMTAEQKMNVYLRLATVDVWDAIMAALNSLPNPSAGYFGGGKVNLPQGRYGISKPVYYPKSGITMEGVGSLSSMLVPLPGFVGTELLRIDPADHPSYVIYRNCNVRDLGFDHNNVAGIRSVTARSLNDNSEFRSIRTINFDGMALLLGKSARAGAILSQGVKVDSWDAITSTDLVDDVFVVDEANECLFINNKAIGLSIGTSNKTGFHIGRNGLAQGITLIGNSVAHIVNGTGIRFNRVERAWATNNTLENVLRDIHIGHDTMNTLCFGVECYANRHYPTPGAPATQRDYYIDRAWSAKVSTRENGAIEFTANALNCEAYVPTNRTDGTTLPPAVTLASTSSVVHETHKNGTAIHHNNASLSFTATAANVFDVKLPGGGFVRGDNSWTSLIAASTKGARLLANGATISASSTGAVVVNSAASNSVALQENGVNKILLDGSGRIRVFGLPTTAPGVADALYKDASGFVRIT